MKKKRVVYDRDLIKNMPYYGIYSKRRIEKIFYKVFDYTLEVAYINVRKSGSFVQKRNVYNVLDKDGKIIYRNKFLYELGDILNKCGLYYGI